MYNSIDHRTALRRICKFCLIIKPERSHHCRVCRKCILKYDHHCKFLSNCIGFANYKYFFVFLFYTLCVLLFVLITLFEGFAINIQVYGWEDSNCKLLAIMYFLTFIVFISVLDLFIFHLVILWKGVTTVENKDKNKKEEERRSCTSRMDESLGSGCCLWFCPTSNILLIYLEPKLKFGGYLPANIVDANKSISRSFIGNNSILNVSHTKK